MKKFFVVAILFVTVLAYGCRNREETFLEEDKDIKGKVMIEIVRSVPGPDSHLYIAAENAYIRDDVVIIEGVVTIMSYRAMSNRSSCWVVPKMEIKEGKLEIPIPKDNKYHVSITKR